MPLKSRFHPASLYGERRAVAVALIFALSIGSVGAPSAFANVRASDRVVGRPASELKVPKAAMPDVEMAAGVLMTEDGRVLWARNPTNRRAMASITKLMTAVVALESSTATETVTVPESSGDVGESTSFLRPGEKLPLSEVLEALLVKSGNDAAVAIAEHVSGGEDEFVKAMNRKAAQMGLKRTRFSNPHGLDANNHYSTAADLGILARYAMTKPLIRRIAGEKSTQIGSGARAETMHSTNLLLGNYAGANGVKTGWTDEAGYCVIESARRDGTELYAVVLGSTGELQRFWDARELLDFGFAHYRPQKLSSAGTVIGEAPVADYLDVTVGAAVGRDTTITVFDLAGPIRRTVSVAEIRAPVKKGDRVGVVTFTQGGEVVSTIPLLAVADVKKPNVFLRVWIAIARAWRWATGG